MQQYTKLVALAISSVGEFKGSKELLNYSEYYAKDFPVYYPYYETRVHA